MVAVQILHSVFVSDATWHVLVLGFYDPMNLVVPPAFAPLEPIFNGISEYLLAVKIHLNNY